MERHIKIILLVIIGCVFYTHSIWSENPQDKNNRGEVVMGEYETFDHMDHTKKFKQKGIKEVVLRDKNGKSMKRFSFTPGDKIENGRHIRHIVKSIKDKVQNHVVVYNQKIDLDERDPFKIRFSSSIYTIWYRADGTLLCELQSHSVPRVISQNGQAIVLIDSGLEPTDLSEKYTKVPELSTEQLKQKSKLIETYLHVMNDTCKIIYSTMSAKGGWNIILISPSGKWLLLEEGESGVFIEGRGWKYFLKVINLYNRQVITMKWDRSFMPREIDDEGTMMTWKKVRDSNRKHKIKVYGGGEADVPYRIYRKYIWKIGNTGFKETTEEKEE